MRNLSCAIMLLFLCSCASSKDKGPKNTDDGHYPLPKNVYLSGGMLCLHLDVGKPIYNRYNYWDNVGGYGMRSPTSSRYLLLDCKSKKVIGTAESSITKDHFQGALFYAKRHIEISDKNGDILITEEMDDATPSCRYIYLQRKEDGNYRTFYLSPKYIYRPGGADIDYFPPTIHFRDKDFDRIPRSTTPFTTG